MASDQAESPPDDKENHMGGYRKLNYDQQLKIHEIEKATHDLREGRANIRREVERRVEAELISLAIIQSKAMNEALQLGVPKSFLARAIGTSNWATLQQKLSLTESLSPLAPSEPLIPKIVDKFWVYDPNTRELFIPDVKKAAKAPGGNEFRLYEGSIRTIHPPGRPYDEHNGNPAWMEKDKYGRWERVLPEPVEEIVDPGFNGIRTSVYEQYAKPLYSRLTREYNGPEGETLFQ